MSLGRPRREEGAVTKGWSGPGRGEVRARNVDDIRDATYGGGRRPIKHARAVVAGWSGTQQLLAALGVVVGTIALLGLLAFALLPQEVEIDGGLARARCSIENDDLVASGAIDTAQVHRYIDFHEVETLTIDVAVSFDSAELHTVSHTIELPVDAGRGSTVPFEFVVRQFAGSSWTCEFTLTANR